ncbi:MULTISPECIES: hypothetical protein [Oscillatoriales]|nr:MULTISPECIES: hypothetical protein [Oscillatoriales]
MLKSIVEDKAIALTQARHPIQKAQSHKAQSHMENEAVRRTDL